MNPVSAETDLLKVQLLDAMKLQFPALSELTFDQAWAILEKNNLIQDFVTVETKTELGGKSLAELEQMASDDGILNNKLALEMIKRPGFKREIVNDLYNGLGVEVHLGREGSYGKGIVLKRKMNLQQFYTHPMVSYIMKEILRIPEHARVYDPTFGSGRLFWHMPNQSMCHGVEIESNAFDIGRALYPQAQLVQDDTALHIHEGQFNYVVTNPPFTIYFEDKKRIFKFVGYNNRILSELAILEIANRSIHNQKGGIALIMPSDAWATKLMDCEEFVKWFGAENIPIAKIALPSFTHEGTVWPVSLYIFIKSYGYRKYENNTPIYSFTYQLKSFEKEEIDRMIRRFREENDRDDENIKEIAKNIDSKQASFALKVETVPKFDIGSYLQSAVEIKSVDNVILDAKAEGLDSFNIPPVTIIPNGIHADLKTRAIRSRYGMKYSPTRKTHVDIFAETIAKLDFFMDPRHAYDDIPLINNLHSYDVSISHSEGFQAALENRKKWIDFQNCPLELWVEETGTENSSNWKQLFQNEGYKSVYPVEYAKWKAKLESLVPQYPWIDKLFKFQKEDVLKMAMKASVINANQMGLGKTRSCIAAALLKGFERNLIVCPSRLVNTWMEEFKTLGLPEPYLVEYNEDLKEMENRAWVLTSMETLRGKKDHPAPKSRAKKNPDGLASNYDLKDWDELEGEMLDMMQAFGIDPDMAESLITPEIITENPKASEGEITKEAQKFMELQKRPLFVDNLKGKFDLMIVDEAHNFSNPTTLRTQAAMRIQPKHFIAATGTPIKNRVKGLLSLLIMGWGEDTGANPYNKTTFLEEFTQYKNVEYEVADAHGYIRTKNKDIEIPQIKNPEKLQALMAPKWIRRTKYEPDVAADRKFPVPMINFIKIIPTKEESVYAEQWYSEYKRLKQLILVYAEELKALKEQNKYGNASSQDQSEMSRRQKELSSLMGIAMTMITKLRAVALAPQIDWLHEKVIAHEMSEDDEEEGEPKEEVEYTSSEFKIKIPNKFPEGMITPRQKQIIDELEKRIKKGEQCYTVVPFPAFNKFLQEQLKKRGIEGEIIDGTVNMSKRNAIIDRFRSKETKLIMATLGTFDTGINIPDADYCCIAAMGWNFSDLQQCWSRFLRPQSVGERTVDIFYLDNSIEVYVKQLVDMKRYNQEYVIDYGPRPPEVTWVSVWSAVEQMFTDIMKGEFQV